MINLVEKRTGGIIEQPPHTALYAIVDDGLVSPASDGTAKTACEGWVAILRSGGCIVDDPKRPTAYLRYDVKESPATLKPLRAKLALCYNSIDWMVCCRRVPTRLVRCVVGVTLHILLLGRQSPTVCRKDREIVEGCCS